MSLKQRMVWQVSITILILISRASAAGHKPDHLSITGHRALAKAIGVLEENYGWLITYEDPRYTYSQDLLDRTPSNSRHPQDSYWTGHVDLVPVERTIDFEYEVDELTSRPLEPEKTVLDRAVSSFGSASGYDFKVKQIGARFHVIPNSGKDATGKTVRQDSLMDAQISFPKVRRNATETLTTICDAISVKTNIPVRKGSYPINLFMQTSTLIGASNRSAREALAFFLDSIDPRLSWKLLYDAGEREYYLSVHRVRSQAEKAQTASSSPIQ